MMEVPGEERSYVISQNMLNLGFNDATLLKVEDELQVVFELKVNSSHRDLKNGEIPNEPDCLTQKKQDDTRKALPKIPCNILLI